MYRKTAGNNLHCSEIQISSQSNCGRKDCLPLKDPRNREVMQFNQEELRELLSAQARAASTFSCQLMILPATPPGRALKNVIFF